MAEWRLVNLSNIGSMNTEQNGARRSSLLASVGVAGLASFAVLVIVGRRSFQRKVVQLTKELEAEGMREAPSKVWAVLTPKETIKVFAIPMAYVLTVTALVGTGLQRWYGIKDFPHAIETLKWVTKTGPPPREVHR